MSRTRDLTDEQCDVISALAFSAMNVSKAALMVGCSRGSMVRKIEGIKRTTGLNPCDFFDLQELFELAGR